MDGHSPTGECALLHNSKEKTLVQGRKAIHTQLFAYILKNT